MKRKVINYVIIISIIIVCISFGYITYNLASNNKNANNNSINNQTNQSIDNSTEQSSTNSDKDKLTEVVLNSKIGNELTSMLYINNIYSSIVYSELETNGISDKFKRMYTFVKVSTGSAYSDFLRESENYVGNYITSKDLETVMKTFFADVGNVSHGKLFDDDSYDSENKNYIIVPIGFAGSDLNIVVDVPYKIEESSEFYYVYMYRVYLTKVAGEDSSSEDVNYVSYYDSQRKNQAIAINDINVDNPDTQVETLEAKINDGSINKSKLKKVQFTIKKQGSKNLISDYKEIK